MKWINDIFVKILIWRIKNLSDRDFVIIVGVLIGLVAGLSAVILKEAVHQIQHLLTGNLEQHGKFLYLGLPLVGIFITVAISHFVFKEQMGHGITNILYSISKNSSRIHPSKMYSRLITSAVTVGFGGSVGLEAPIVVTGSAIGSNIARAMHLDYKKRTLLIGCGAAAAISAIFNSPIAGVIFSAEIILAEVTVGALIPLLIASVSGQLVSMLLLEEHILFYYDLKDPFTATDVSYYILLGILCGFVSLFFTRSLYKIESLIARVKHPFTRVLIGGLCLGAIIFVFPPIYGEGYDTIKNLLGGEEQLILNKSLLFQNLDSQWYLLLFVLGVILMKPAATALTIGSGGSGGIFAPSLFLGGITGFLFAQVTNIITSAPTISVSNFTLVGMCGIMSGVLHAPLTAIFLIAEITSGYTLFVPLMIVSAIAYLTTSYYEKHSFYTKHLIEKGELVQFDKDRQVLSLIHLKKMIETDLSKISPDDSLDDLIKQVRRTHRNIFPVVNNQGQLEGIVTLDDIREIMFDEVRRKTVLVKSLMHQPPEQVSSYENMQSVMNKFERTGAWNLPVIDDDKYVGFVSKSRIFNAYRQKLISHNRY